MNAPSKRSKVAAFLAILVISAATMIVLFWLFPLTTAVVALGLFALLGLSARLAQGTLSEITGQFGSEDLLGEIFRSFCIGK